MITSQKAQECYATADAMKNLKPGSKKKYCKILWNVKYKTLAGVRKH
jgi:hypothetical protein